MGSIYIAGKLASAEDTITEFTEELEGRGHTITLKWWELPKLPTPYLAHLESSRVAAGDMERAVREAHTALVLFPDAKILGAAVEFGVAIGDRILRPDREIVVVNPFENRQSVFYAHPSVIAVRGLDDIRERPWY